MQSFQLISTRLAGEKYLITIFVFAFGIRLINILFLSGQSAYFSQDDSALYWNLGAALSESATFRDALLTSTERMPLYPLFLAGVRHLFGDAPGVAVFLQTFFDSVTCTLIAALGSLYSRRVGLIAGLFAALSMNLIIFSSQILTDTAFVTFFTSFLYLAARFLKSPSNWTIALAGLFGGLSLAVRPVPAIMLAAGLPLVLYLSYVRSHRLIATLFAGLLFVLGVVLPIAPVLLRNVTQYGSWKLMSEGGDHLAYWIVPLVAQRADGTPYQRSVETMRVRYERRLLELGVDRQANPFQLDEIKTDVAREAMNGLPAAAFIKAWLDGMLVNLAAPAIIMDPRVRALPKPSFYDTAGKTLWARGSAYFFEGRGLYPALLLLGLAAGVPVLFLQAQGFFILYLRWPGVALLSGLVVLYFLLISGPVATPKYRLPIEPVLIVLTAIAVDWWWRARSIRATRML